MKIRIKISIIFFLFAKTTFAQTDSLPYTLFNSRIVLYSDLGYTSAPFSISYPFSNAITKLRYRNNYRAVLGIGISYKWLALRLGFPLPGYTRSRTKYGETRPFNVGFDFTLKKMYCSVDLRVFQGYAIKDAFTWNDSLNPEIPNDIRPSTQVTSFSINGWYFNDRDFKISALNGKTGHYNERVHTWYLKHTFNVFGVNNENNPLIPSALKDSKKQQTQASFFTATDLGIVPGYAYVDRINNWQFAFMGGFGFVVQSKFYGNQDITRGFLGLAPRYDVKFIAGYSAPNYFVFLHTDFDNKSIRFSNLVYRQHFYSIKLVVGRRFSTKTKKKKLL